jgi:hypothetical protein
MDGCVRFDLERYLSRRESRSCRSSSSRQVGSKLSGHPVLLRRSSRFMDRVSSRAPHLLETSLPGVFAVGDVRGGNIKHVASAVGEGSIAISLLPELGELQILSQSSSGFTKPSSGASTDCFIHRIATEAGPKGPLKQLLPCA